jgi:hypothetical protein
MQKYLAGLVVLLAIAMLTSGCAVGNRHHYQDVLADIQYSGDIAVGVGTQDARPYVISGDKPPSFVGLSRGGFGNTFDINTESGRPLADDVNQDISRSLAQKGFKPVSVALSPQDDDAAVFAKLSATKAPRLLWLKIAEWKSDTYTNTALIYNVDLRVMDESGKILAEKFLEGRDNLKGSVMNPPAHAKKVVPIAFKEKLEALLNDPGVQNALK